MTNGDKSTSTRNLREGDVVLVLPNMVTREPRRVTRAPSGQGQPRTVKYAQPDPRTRWEYRKPTTSARWSVYFTDGTHAGATRDAEWATP